MRLLVVVDDAHWADGPSLRWLEYLAASIDDLPVLLCVGLDPAYVTDHKELLLSLSAQATTLALTPLSVPATERLVEQRLGPGTWDGLGAACHADTGGNPFLLHAVLDELCDRGGDSRQTGSASSSLKRFRARSTGGWLGCRRRHVTLRPVSPYGAESHACTRRPLWRGSTTRTTRGARRTP